MRGGKMTKASEKEGWNKEWEEKGGREGQGKRRMRRMKKWDENKVIGSRRKGENIVQMKRKEVKVFFFLSSPSFVQEVLALLILFRTFISGHRLIDIPRVSASMDKGRRWSWGWTRWWEGEPSVKCQRWRATCQGLLRLLLHWWLLLKTGNGGKSGIHWSFEVRKRRWERIGRYWWWWRWSSRLEGSFDRHLNSSSNCPFW